MNPFITGSRAYGTHTSESDVDLVVYITPGELAVLRDRADSDDREKVKNDSDAGPTGGTGVSASLRFGQLNLLCVTDPVAYAVWVKGTSMLKHQAPVSRDTAIKFFDALRHHHGLCTSTPAVADFEKSRGLGGFEIGDGVEVLNSKGVVKFAGVITEFDHDDEEDELAVVSCKGVDRSCYVKQLRKVKGLPGYEARKTPNLDDIL